MITYDPQTPPREAIGKVEETYRFAETVEEPLDEKVCHYAPRLRRVDGMHALVLGRSTHNGTAFPLMSTRSTPLAEKSTSISPDADEPFSVSRPLILKLVSIERLSLRSVTII